MRKLRQAAGWKLKHLKERSGVSLTAIHELEMGVTKEATRAILTKIAAAFGLTLNELLSQVPTIPVRLDVPAPPLRNAGETSEPATMRRQVRGKKSA